MAIHDALFLTALLFGFIGMSSIMFLAEGSGQVWFDRLILVAAILLLIAAIGCVLTGIWIQV